MVGDVAQRDAPLDVAECGGERVVARARGDRRVGPRRLAITRKWPTAPEKGGE